MVIGRVNPNTKPVKVGDTSSRELTTQPAPLLSHIPAGATTDNTTVDVTVKANNGVNTGLADAGTNLSTNGVIFESTQTAKIAGTIAPP